MTYASGFRAGIEAAAKVATAEASRRYERARTPLPGDENFPFTLKMVQESLCTCLSKTADAIRSIPTPEAPATPDREMLREAVEVLRPFAEAWEVATYHQEIICRLSMAQLGELAAHELSGVHFRNARAFVEKAKEALK